MFSSNKGIRFSDGTTFTVERVSLRSFVDDDSGEKEPFVEALLRFFGFGKSGSGSLGRSTRIELAEFPILVVEARISVPRDVITSRVWSEEKFRERVADFRVSLSDKEGESWLKPSKSGRSSDVDPRHRAIRRYYAFTSWPLEERTAVLSVGRVVGEMAGEAGELEIKIPESPKSQQPKVAAQALPQRRTFGPGFEVHLESFEVAERVFDSRWMTMFSISGVRPPEMSFRFFEGGVPSPNLEIYSLELFRGGGESNSPEVDLGRMGGGRSNGTERITTSNAPFWAGDPPYYVALQINKNTGEGSACLTLPTLPRTLDAAHPSVSGQEIDLDKVESVGILNIQGRTVEILGLLRERLYAGGRMLGWKSSSGENIESVRLLLRCRDGGEGLVVSLQIQGRDMNESGFSNVGSTGFWGNLGDPGIGEIEFTLSRKENVLENPAIRISVSPIWRADFVAEPTRTSLQAWHAVGRRNPHQSLIPKYVTEPTESGTINVRRVK